jgi:mannose-1-phosphate guanylyltransferase/mannose-6-phosphate isomerase
MKKKEDRFVVLLAGGEGSRFWPQSRTLEPKQFLHLDKGRSLFRQSLDRVIPLVPGGHIYIVTSSLYRDIIRAETSLFKIPDANLIFEPKPKNTAPAIALTVKIILDSCQNEDAQVVVMPCDHLIKNSKRFSSLLKRAFGHCQDRLIIFGIPPHRPATGYGYIKTSAVKNLPGNAIRDVLKFCEKPDLKTAKRFLKNGHYFWNSGIFVGTIKQFEASFKRYLPQLFRQIFSGKAGQDIIAVWNRIQPVSFDYGVLEKMKSIGMIQADRLGWSDLGSWQAWDELQKKDKNHNLFLADVIDIESRGLTVIGYKHLIATIGLKGLVVVDTPDALLVADKKRSEEVKKIVEVLKKEKREEHYAHTTVKRPWGSYTVLDIGSRFKVKLVEVNPHKALSLQSHRKRSEHWVVTEGTAKIVKGRKTYFLYENQSTFIPMACIHRIINPTDSVLKIIEVQAGDYLGEDDIVRVKDDFGRKGN